MVRWFFASITNPEKLLNDSILALHSVCDTCILKLFLNQKKNEKTKENMKIVDEKIQWKNLDMKSGKTLKVRENTSLEIQRHNNQTFQKQKYLKINRKTTCSFWLMRYSKLNNTVTHSNNYTAKISKWQHMCKWALDHIRCLLKEFVIINVTALNVKGINND